jgi:hypothetical protein
MRHAGRRLAWGASAALALAALSPSRALAYRPFDLTDAEVAPAREVELELGPFAAVHTAGDTSLAPGFVLNYGLTRRVELVAEDHNRLAAGASETSPPSQTAAAILVKGILREGALQEQTGPSVALEVGVLLPVLPAPEGFGASTALIVSERWPATTIHVNVQVDLSREHHLDALGGAIVEGPHTWRVRPVGEAYVEHEGAGAIVLSALGGAIWQLREDLSFDAAARAARDDALAVLELRLGLTWAFAL